VRRASSANTLFALWRASLINFLFTRSFDQPVTQKTYQQVAPFRPFSVKLLKQLSLDVTAREGELLKPDTLTSVMRNIDVVIHLAAVMDFYPNDVKGLYRVNVEGTTNLLNAFIAERQNHHSYPTRFIYISSTENILQYSIYVLSTLCVSNSS